MGWNGLAKHLAGRGAVRFRVAASVAAALLVPSGTSMAAAGVSPPRPVDAFVDDHADLTEAPSSAPVSPAVVRASVVITHSLPQRYRLGTPATWGVGVVASPAG